MIACCAERRSPSISTTGKRNWSSSRSTIDRTGRQCTGDQSAIMTPPLFSIVIPTYNRSELVQGAVRSILDQTFDDYEVVVSDNCSQDDTQAVIAGFQDPRVR